MVFDPVFITVMGGVFAALLTTIVGLVTAFFSNRSAREGQRTQAELDWFTKLSEKITSLELRIEKMEKESSDRGRIIGLFGDFLDEISLHILHGGRGKYPRSHEDLNLYFNSERWNRIADDADEPTIDRNDKD